MLPSVNYRVFIKNATFAPEQDEISDWEPVDSVRSLYRRNRRIVARFEATNGQLIYYSDRVVAASRFQSVSAFVGSLIAGVLAPN